MAIITGIGELFLEEILQGRHTLDEGSPTDTLKCALFGPNASIGPTTDVYSTTNEVSGGGYTAGGVTLVLEVVGKIGSARSGGVRFADGAYIQPTLDTSITFTGTACRGLMIYNTTVSNRNIFTLDFGQNLVPVVGVKINWALGNVVNFSDVLIPLIGRSI